MEYLRGELTKSQERVIYLEGLIFTSVGLVRSTTREQSPSTLEPTISRPNWRTTRQQLEKLERDKANSKVTTVVEDPTTDSSIDKLEKEVLDG